MATPASGWRFEAVRGSNLPGRVRTLVDRHPVITIFLLALVSRVLIAVALSDYFSGQYVSDDSTYFDMARAKAVNDTGHWDQFTHTLFEKTATLLIPISLAFELFGASKMVGELVVAVWGAAAAALATRLALEVLSRQWAVAVGLILALLPSQVLWSALILKDAPVWSVLIALALLVSIAGRVAGWKLVACAVGVIAMLYLLAHLRMHTLVVACIALMIAGWVGRRSLIYQRALGAVVIGIAFPWLMGLGPAGSVLLGGAESLQAKRAANAQYANSALVETTQEPPGSSVREASIETVSIETVQKLSGKIDRQLNEILPALGTARKTSLDVSRSSRGTAQFQQVEEQIRRIQVDVKRLEQQAAKYQQIADHLLRIATASEESATSERVASGELKHLPRGLSAMLLEPFPWTTGGSFSLQLARLEIFVWWPILLLALLGMRRALRSASVTLFPIVFGIGSLTVYALAEGNLGTAYRHRGEFIWVVALLAGFGLLQLSDVYRRRKTSGVNDRTK